MMWIENAFNHGDKVYLIHDPYQKERMVTAINVRKHELVYCVRCGTEESFHYEYELREDKTIT